MRQTLRTSLQYSELDDAFLRYIEATPENQRRIQSFYLPLFTDKDGLVVDLACGHGDFVELLRQYGVDALGVDRDAACCEEAQSRGINVLCSDVFDYLEQVEEGSLSGVFSAHLVEHLPYRQVMELIQLAHRGLQPGGVLVLTTPNVRGLYPHLESFYMHFGHVAFYHPKLLCFFLDYLGFSSPRIGENPRMAHPLWPHVAWTDPNGAVAWSKGDSGCPPPTHYPLEQASAHTSILARVIAATKTRVIHLVVQPLLDRLLSGVNQSIIELRRYVRQLNANVNATHRRLMGLDRAVECYVYATKGKTELDLPPELVGQRP